MIPSLKTFSFHHGQNFTLQYFFSSSQDFKDATPLSSGVKMLLHYLLAYITSDKKSLFFYGCNMSFFSFAAFKILFLPLFYSSSNTIYIVGVCVCVCVLFHILWTFWICDLMSFINFRKFSAIISSNIVSPAFSCLAFWDSEQRPILNLHIPFLLTSLSYIPFLCLCATFYVISPNHLLVHKFSLKLG